ncbi:unnamed protein product, partial [Polarella glacialis]
IPELPWQTSDIASGMLRPQRLLLVVSACCLSSAGVQAADGFQRYGDGECISPGLLQVRGKTRRDVSHGECRAVCDNDECIGYTYSPCERICLIHGDPNRLPEMPEPDRWAISNGGGVIDHSSGRCGSACFVRMSPCPAGQIESNGARIPYPGMKFSTSRNETCPFPYKGSLHLQCGLSGVEVSEGDRCLRPCVRGNFSNGQFEVQYEPAFHGEESVGWCPKGTLGNMTVVCIDGQVKYVRGVCGSNCAAGSLQSGSTAVHYSGMVHEAVDVLPCPSGYVGQVKIGCLNAIVMPLSGECRQTCARGTIDTMASGLGGPKVAGIATHISMTHLSGRLAVCSSPDDMLIGSIAVFCVDGTVTPEYSQGYCKRHCPAGQMETGAKAVSYGKMPHGGNITLMCNNGFTGMMKVTCSDGAVSVVEGSCRETCLAGTITSNGVTISHPALSESQNLTLQCPLATHTGTLLAVCDDGLVKNEGGFCGKNCSGGVQESNGAFLEYSGLQHGSIRNFSCPYPYGSYLTIRCY